MISHHSFFIPIFALVAFNPVILANQASSIHHHDPFEIDVESESCNFNTIEGFAGDIGTDFFTVEYYYAVQVDASLLEDTEVSYKEPTNFGDLPEDSLQHVILEIELALAAHLLHQSDAFDSSRCNHGRRRLDKAQSGGSKRRTARDRRMKNVGLTIGPDDEFLALCEIQTEGQPCYEYAGRFQVYTVGEDDDTTGVESEIKHAIKDAMNSGEFDDAHPALLSVKYLDVMPEDPADGVQADGEDAVVGNTTQSTIQDGPNASIIIGASVGAVLLIATVALVRRRRHNSGLEANHLFQISQEDSGAEESFAYS